MLLIHDMEDAMNMDASAARWYSDLDIDDTFLSHWELGAMDQLDAEELTLSLGQELRQSMSPESYTSCPSYQRQRQTQPPPASSERPRKIHKTSGWTSSVVERKSNPSHGDTTPKLLTFGDPDPRIDQLSFFRGYAESASTKKGMGSVINCSSKRDYGIITNGHGHRGANMTAPRQGPQNTEHILAERKRREKLSQSFVALSAIVPGLKKMDKASVLGDAIKYMKQLEEKVKSLEEQVAKRTVESAVLIKKSQLCTDEDASSCDDNSDGRESCNFLPEIEAKMSEKSVLVKIHCENRKGMLVKALSEIEKLHLSVVSTGVVPFVSSLDITVTARIEDEFSMTVKDLVKNLNSALGQFT